MASPLEAQATVEASEDTSSHPKPKVVYAKYVIKSSKMPKAGRKARTVFFARATARAGSTEHVLELPRPHSKLFPQFHFQIVFFAFTVKRQSKIKISNS